MWSTLDLLRRVKASRKAIVVLTDGVDESLLDEDYERAEHSFEELLARVSEEDATMRPIYLNREDAELTSELSPSKTERRRERVERRLKPILTAHRQIEQLAEESAGSVFLLADGAGLAIVQFRALWLMPLILQKQFTQFAVVELHNCTPGTLSLRNCIVVDAVDLAKTVYSVCCGRIAQLHARHPLPSKL